jgi:hypothetical protein
VLHGNFRLPCANLLKAEELEENPADPVAVQQPEVNAPQSWNAYSYVRNNPVNLTDPTGAIFCRPASDAEKGEGVSQVCDVTDSQYVNSSKGEQAAYDQAGYQHYDWRVAQAFDLADITNNVGAPSFAHFAKSLP